ncbi:GGDEF domain-containing protein [Niveibacterium sp.]|uniref:GGDEF domain-containing protein n=1 Tax=Niveibacterium sp. TaxID=2017444 RepID=UPI0035B00EDE
MEATTFTNVQIERAQRLRLRRCLLSCLFYAASASLLAVACGMGLFPRNALYLVLVSFFCTPALFVAVIATGANLRCRDPSLTEAQIAAAMLNCTLVLTFAGPLRGIVMFAYLLPLQFGAFALTTPVLLRLCLIPAAGLPFAIAASHWLGMRGAALELELVQWMALMLVLPFTAYVAGRLFEYTRYKRLSDHDELSGLYNRRAALAYLDQLTRLSTPNQVEFCVAVLDFDHFKQINDRFGHAAGDEVIRGFALLARDNLRKGDVIARWGGEEFVVVLHGDSEQARNSIERLRMACASHVVTAIGGAVTLSAGLARHLPGESIASVIERADHALYAAKRAGRNRTELASLPLDRRQAGTAP